MHDKPRDPVRRFLDALYRGSGALAALFLLGIFVLMMVQVAGRELGLQVRGADDLTAWFCAASSFLALAHTFKSGELIRVGLWLEHLSPRGRWRAELFALGTSGLFLAYMVYAVAGFVYESWKFKELAQGLLPIPIWIPQSGFLAGAALLFIAVTDELVRVLRHEMPEYERAERERLARGDFSDGL